MIVSLEAIVRVATEEQRPIGCLVAAMLEMYFLFCLNLILKIHFNDTSLLYFEDVSSLNVPYAFNVACSCSIASAISLLYG